MLCRKPGSRLYIRGTFFTWGGGTFFTRGILSWGGGHLQFSQIDLTACIAFGHSGGFKKMYSEPFLISLSFKFTNFTSELSILVSLKKGTVF